MASSPAKSSLGETATPAFRDPALKLSPAQRLFLVLSGYIPFLNLIILAALAVLAHRLQQPALMLVLPIGWLLLVPPVVVRIILALRPLPRTEIEIGSAPF